MRALTFDDKCKLASFSVAPEGGRARASDEGLVSIVS